MPNNPNPWRSRHYADVPNTYNDHNNNNNYNTTTANNNNNSFPKNSKKPKTAKNQWPKQAEMDKTAVDKNQPAPLDKNQLTAVEGKQKCYCSKNKVCLRCAICVDCGTSKKTRKKN